MRCQVRDREICERCCVRVEEWRFRKNWDESKRVRVWGSALAACAQERGRTHPRRNMQQKGASVAPPSRELREQTSTPPSTRIPIGAAAWAGCWSAAADIYSDAIARAPRRRQARCEGRARSWCGREQSRASRRTVPPAAAAAAKTSFCPFRSEGAREGGTWCQSARPARPPVFKSPTGRAGLFQRCIRHAVTTFLLLLQK